MDKLTPQLTELQLKENIDTLLKQGLKPIKVQEYVNNYSKSSDGNYVLKGQMTTTTPNMTTPENIEQQETTLNEPQKKSLIQKISDVIGGFGAGAIKGGLSTLSNIGTPIVKQLNRVMPLLPEEQIGLPKSITEPVGTAEKAGFGAEQIGEYFIPAGKAAKAEKVIDVLSKGIKSPLLSATTRVLGKAGVQGLSAGGVGLAQTGDIKEAGKIAGTAGIIRGGMGVLGETARALKIPERVYSVIFKNSKLDMRTELTSDALLDLQRKNPTKFQDFVDKGIIKTKGDIPIINDTVAEQALDKGLKGSFKNMATEVIQKSFQSEDDLQNILKNYKGTVDVSEKQFTNLLKNISQEYEDVGFGEVAKQADDLYAKITSANGKVDGLTALDLRRFLDRMRVASSFDKPVSKLSMTQANFKTLADSVRSRLSKIEGVPNIMKDYSFYIDALDDIAKEAAKRGNAQVLGMIDSLFLGGAAISNDPTSILTIGLLRRMVQSPTALTNIGQAVKSSTLGAGTSGALGVGSKEISNVVSPQSNQQ